MTSVRPNFLRCPDCIGELSGNWPGAADAELQCRGCGARYRVDAGIPNLIGQKSELNTSELATQDHVADYYDGLRYRQPSSIAYHEDTLSQLVELVPPRGVVLDDGCGTGAFLEFARRKRTQPEQYIGVDISGGMLAHAARRLEGVPAPTLLRADACRLPFADESFDVVYARGMLHHLPDPAAGVREIARVLKPGGLAAMLDPNKTIISELPRRLARGTAHFDADHKNFDVAELTRIVSAALRVRDTRFFGYIAYPLLGFPDLINFDRIGMGRLVGPLLRLDRKLAELPYLQRLGWGVIIAAEKRA